eukprot:EG_transcript_5772
MLHGGTDAAALAYARDHDLPRHLDHLLACLMQHRPPSLEALAERWHGRIDDAVRRGDKTSLKKKKKQAVELQLRQLLSSEYPAPNHVSQPYLQALLPVVDRLVGAVVEQRPPHPQRLFQQFIGDALCRSVEVEGLESDDIVAACGFRLPYCSSCLTFTWRDGQSGSRNFSKDDSAFASVYFLHDGHAEIVEDGFGHTGHGGPGGAPHQHRALGLHGMADACIAVAKPWPELEAAVVAGCVEDARLLLQQRRAAGGCVDPARLIRPLMRAAGHGGGYTRREADLRLPDPALVSLLQTHGAVLPPPFEYALLQSALMERNAAAVEQYVALGLIQTPVRHPQALLSCATTGATDIAIFLAQCGVAVPELAHYSCMENALFLFLAFMPAPEILRPLLAAVPAHPPVLGSYSILHAACANGRCPLAVCQLILEAKPELVDLRLCTDHVLAEEDELERFQCLGRGKGCDVRGGTALSIACALGAEAKALALLQAKANVSIAAHNGWTPLHFAAAAGATTLVAALLDAGADPLQANRDGQPPGQAARPEIRALLAPDYLAVLRAIPLGPAAVRAAAQAGAADLNAQDRLGVTPLIEAVLLQSEAVVQVLLSLGADPTLATRWGVLPCVLAHWAGAPPVMALLPAPEGKAAEQLARLREAAQADPHAPPLLA